MNWLNLRTLSANTETAVMCADSVVAINLHQRQRASRSRNGRASTKNSIGLLIGCPHNFGAGLWLQIRLLSGSTLVLRKYIPKSMIFTTKNSKKPQNLVYVSKKIEFIESSYVTPSFSKISP
jgi:hypothetical protein